MYIIKNTNNKGLIMHIKKFILLFRTETLIINFNILQIESIGHKVCIDIKIVKIG